jgi:hypothetical protein
MRTDGQTDTESSQCAFIIFVRNKKPTGFLLTLCKYAASIEELNWVENNHKLSVNKDMGIGDRGLFQGLILTFVSKD